MSDPKFKPGDIVRFEMCNCEVGANELCRAVTSGPPSARRSKSAIGTILSRIHHCNVPSVITTGRVVRVKVGIGGSPEYEIETTFRAAPGGVNKLVLPAIDVELDVEATLVSLAEQEASVDR